MASSHTVSGTTYFNVKTVLIGDLGVGKTAFLNTFIHGKFIAHPSHKHKNDKPNEFLYEDKRICLKIWDTAGMERFRSLTASYFRDARACVVFFDITNEETFANVQGWLDDLWRNITKGQHCCVFLVGTKLDQNERDVAYERADAFAEAHNLQYFEASAKDVESVNRVIHKLVDHFAQELVQSTAAYQKKSQSGLQIHKLGDSSTSVRRSRCSC